MNKPARPARWYAPWRTHAVDEDDPADLGTAFGLDLSMAPLAEPGAAPRQSPATGADTSGWMSRWAGRKRASA